MAKSIFQKAADWIQGFKTPEWLSAMFFEIQLFIWSVAQEEGEDYIDSLKNKIVEVGKTNLSNEDKFKTVFDFAKSQGVEVKDRYIRLLIEATYNWLKEKEILP